MGRSTPAFRVLFAFGSTKKISRPGRNAPTVRPSQIPALEKSRPRKEEAPGKPGLPHRWGYGAVRPRPHQLAVLGLGPSPRLCLAAQSARVSRRETCKGALTPFGIQRQQKKRKASPPLADARCPPLGGWGKAPVLLAGGLVASPARNKPFVKTAPMGPVFPFMAVLNAFRVKTRNDRGPEYSGPLGAF